jgi:hypothetical protein
LCRVPHGFTRHRTRIDDDRIIKARLARVAAHNLGLIRIEPAAERDHLGFGHERSDFFLKIAR